MSTLRLGPARERTAPAVGWRAPSERKLPEGGPRARRRDVAEITDALSLMMGSGLMLGEALEVAASVFQNRRVAGLLAALRSRVERGGSLHSALEALPESFSPVYRSLIRIGERTGSIESVLKRLSAHLRREGRIRERLSGALAYPTLVLLVALGAVVTILVFVLPRMRAILELAGGDSLREATARLQVIGPSLGVIAGGILLAALSVPAFVLARRLPRAAAMIDALLLRLPLVGAGLLRLDLHRFCFAMTTLTGSGVSVEEALSESAQAVANGQVRAQVLEAAALARTGLRLSEAFRRQPALAGRVARWVAVGERTGSVEAVFDQLAGYLDREIERDTERLVTLIEPAVILLVGIVITYLLFAFVIPIFSLLGSIL